MLYRGIFDNGFNNPVGITDAWQIVIETACLDLFCFSGVKKAGESFPRDRTALSV
jgi:hypothetical protein